jgi:thioredoxin reductase
MKNVKYDFVIIGGGPAGLQLGYFLEKAGRDYVILEAGEAAGTFFAKFPRHRKLISANKVYTGYTDSVRNLRWDWNSLISDDEALLFKNYSRDFFPDADEMVLYLNDFANKLALNIRYKSPVLSVRRDGAFHIVLESGEELSSRCLVVATGVTKHYFPDVPGIELAESYADMSIDPADFVDQKVLIIGKGNSAFETADNLMSAASRIYVCSPTPITLSWKSKFVGHLRAVNNNFIDTYQLKLQNVMLDAKVLKIARKNTCLEVTFHYGHAADEVETMVFDRVISCTGFCFDDAIFDENCKPALAINGRFPDMTASFESTNIPGLFFAGTLMQRLDYKKKQSGFVHGFRHNIENLFHGLEERY